LKISVRTLSAQAHLEVCALIKFYGSTIVKDSVSKSGCYGFFIIETPRETVDSFIVLEDSVVDLNPA